MATSEPAVERPENEDEEAVWFGPAEPPKVLSWAAVKRQRKIDCGIDDAM